MAEKMETRPLSELFTELSQETRTLIKQEMDLVRVELSEKISHIVKDVAALGLGGVLLYSGFLTLIAAIVLGLAVFMPLWLAALLVSILIMVVGFVLVQKGRKDLVNMEMKPKKSTETFKETAKWAKTELKSGRATRT